MGMSETLAEIRTRHTVVMDGPEAEGAAAFYSAATMDVGALLGMVDALLADGVSEAHAAEILALQEELATVTQQLADEGQAHVVCKRKYRRLRDALDALPPREADAGGAAPGGPGGGK